MQVVSDLKFTRSIIANLTQKSNLKRDRRIVSDGKKKRDAIYPV